ncbi:MAG: DUF2141 domain-containing protein [Planctomycetes bacterium]|nr:DUF2141 domain-containing protein [Planctomycetota bacterium]
MFFCAMIGCGDLGRVDRVESSKVESSKVESSKKEPAELQADGAALSLRQHGAVSGKSTRLLVEVEISGFQNQEGKCRLAAYDSPSGFQNPDLALARSTIPIDGKSIRWSFEWNRESDDTGPGQLAISAHHDRNENGQLDKNLVGMPTESYGFSNNPKRGYGPPKFEQVVVTRPDDASLSSPWRIEITIK